MSPANLTWINSIYTLIFNFVYLRLFLCQLSAHTHILFAWLDRLSGLCGFVHAVPDQHLTHLSLCFVICSPESALWFSEQTTLFVYIQCSSTKTHCLYATGLTNVLSSFLMQLFFIAYTHVCLLGVISPFPLLVCCCICRCMTTNYWPAEHLEIMYVLPRVHDTNKTWICPLKTLIHGASSGHKLHGYPLRNGKFTPLSWHLLTSCNWGDEWEVSSAWRSKKDSLQPYKLLFHNVLLMD